jgi:hypothetical protein
VNKVATLNQKEKRKKYFSRLSFPTKQLYYEKKPEKLMGITDQYNSLHTNRIMWDSYTTKGKVRSRTNQQIINTSDIG